jgi:DNA-binding NarL/FixJ family response regulator
MAKIRVMIVDDHEVVRKGLRTRFETEQNLEVVGEAGDGFEAMEKIKVLAPDILLMDLQLPNLSGVEAIRQISKVNANVKIIAYTFYGDESTVLSALHAGAMGYVLKSSSMSELIEAIKNVQLGRRYLGSPLPDLAIDALLNIRKVAPRDPYALLTTREKEILQLVTEKNNNAQIAQKLFISRRTVEIHRSHIMKKLGLRRPQVDLVQYAAERGLIKPLYHVDQENVTERPG